LSVRADVAFTRLRIAVFVDGCFWHGCKRHGRVPKANSAYWEAKLARNLQRDTTVNADLKAAGWQVIRVWEHSPTSISVSRVIKAVKERSIAEASAKLRK
jgi:DNA mismatch endonuclease (patch repair protein)